MKSDMSRRYHTRVVTNIIYSAIITCLVEIFLVANVTMIARYMEEAGKLNRLLELLMSTNVVVVLAYVLSGIVLFSVTFLLLQGPSIRYISHISDAIQNLSLIHILLLFGDAGTGKSSSVKAILNEYYSRGLRIIEVYKHQFKALSDVLEQIKDRNYKFIIYMDDLSFEDYELEYKYLKAILEGGLGKRPRNVLIYATSNRRHLIREKFSDKRELDDELHGNDTVQEKLSLAARFGVTIYFGSPDKFEFQRIVKVLAERYHVNMPEEQLYAEANKWELSHGGLSGRTASQFITHLLGTLVE